MTQPGQKTLTTGLPGIPATKPGGLGIDNGGPIFDLLPAGGGTLTLNGATPVVVADKRVNANSIIVFTVITPAGTISPNAPNVLTKTPGIGFTVGGTALDTGVYGYAILG